MVETDRDRNSEIDIQTGRQADTEKDRETDREEHASFQPHKANVIIIIFLFRIVIFLPSSS